MRFTERVGPWPMLLTCVALVAPCRSSGAAGPPERTVAFLVAESSVEKLGPEDHAAWQLAEEIASASLVVAAGGGQFVDRQGQPVALDAFDVVWYHQGDSIEQSGSVYDPRSLEALRAYVAGGHGLFLSGAALGMVHALRVEPVSPRRGGPGDDASPAALVPLVPQHPVFRDILAAGTPGQNTGRPIDLSDRGFPAFADFYALGGPVGGMLLGRSPGGSENPLVEYELEKGRIVFSSTAPFVGVPCVRGGSHVTNLYLWDPKGAIRQLTVDQEHNWCPTVLNNGRVLYLRWEYTDMPHAFYRILFHMNPDGTEQMEYYGSNSYWPNAMFFARPVPGHPTKVVAVVGGHHAPGRTGELVIFDPARGRFEADGAVQRIPGRGQAVEPILLDGLASQSWPKFLHPYPLGEKHFLVACQPNQQSVWGIYLVDVFDNMVRLCEQPGYAMLEPIPLRKTPKPPTLPDKVDPRRDDAVVFMADVYSGGGLKGVPRGTVKELRLISYHFSYQGMGGQVDRVGLDGPWDVKQIVGTVPVEEDGSARFRVPACTPIAVQPLDAEGKAIQLMRSWFTAMPGEVLSCVGCHEHQNTSPPARTAIAATRPPSEIEPWYGPARGFSFRREVQPVLDKHCVGCHDGKPRPDGPTLADLTDRPDVNVEAASGDYNQAAHFSPSYLELRKFVRSPTIESDLHMLAPREFHADTTKLVQMLRKGHAGVQLDDEAWDRLITWIDLHTPFHGTWTEVCGTARVENQHRRRREMRKLYTGRDDDPEAVAPPVAVAVDPVAPPLEPASAAVAAECPGWPFGLEEARRRQQGDGSEPVTVAVELPDGISLDLVRIPVGEFVMGDPDGAADEGPACRVAIDRPFWMSRCEITNAQYARFDPTHDSRLETGDFLQFDHRERGYPVNEPRQPVVRVSWNEATAFCGWLSEKTGRRFTLPSEAQWEYACRAGTATPLWYGTLDDDFSTVGNLSDVSNHAVDTFGWALPSGAVPPWRPADCRFNDGFRVSAPVGRFAPNPWGLFDMHGNGAEWTRSAYRPYPYHATDGHEAIGAADRMVVRGGSWYDRPKRCRSAFRLAYPPDQLVFDVGFRVICEVLDGGRSAADNERSE
ncbi:MAG: SUMF1/EgtB/PvdO family nonheme iron enzyme [Planctomycetota bacterium]